MIGIKYSFPSVTQVDKINLCSLRITYFLMRTRKSKQFSNKIVVSNLVLFSMDSLAVTDLFPHNSDPENLVTEEFSIKCQSIWTILFCLLPLLPSFGVCIQFTRACWMPKHVFLLLLFVYFLIFCSFVLRRWNDYTLASPTATA